MYIVYYGGFFQVTIAKKPKAIPRDNNVAITWQSGTMSGHRYNIWPDIGWTFSLFKLLFDDFGSYFQSLTPYRSLTLFVDIGQRRPVDRSNKIIAPKFKKQTNIGPIKSSVLLFFKKLKITGNCSLFSFWRWNNEEIIWAVLLYYSFR